MLILLKSPPLLHPSYDSSNSDRLAKRRLLYASKQFKLATDCLILLEKTGLNSKSISGDAFSRFDAHKGKVAAMAQQRPF